MRGTQKRPTSKSKVVAKSIVWRHERWVRWVSPVKQVRWVRQVRQVRWDEQVSDL
jgi:hypothetical protein